ncbi:GNAT family N-acetyltransferase [Actinoplanes sp. DH11]|uniref:GNAT family N-acetyltransferase n=1 Tax=Actinoplanes sp. DH11 TaxID=2857011 RepID=UPI001E5DD1C0|nr:GNAT family N-acetyltransferase [Actinoplanes sp. DH11]
MTELPAGWTLRRPTLDDAPRILEMVHASDIAAVGEADFTLDEVHEELTGPHTDMNRDSWLVLDDGGRIAGWAYPRNPTGKARDFVEVYVHPEIGLPAQRPLLRLMMARMAERAAELGHQVYAVRAAAVPTETRYIDALTDAGFTFRKQHARMQMPLAGVSPQPPEPPAGVLIRPVRAGDETEMRQFHAVIEAAFQDSDHRALAYPDWREQFLAESGVDFAEWFVAETDGVIAGALQSGGSGGDDENDEGWVKSLGVLRPYRKRGVGEALLRRALAVYAAQGRAKAGLGVDLANPTDAASLYRKVGMTALYRANVYETTVPAASDLR